MTFPERQFDEDRHTLLGVESQRWPNGTANDETELESPSLMAGSREGIW